MTAPAKPTIDEQILQNQLAACQKECKEQARLNGMGSEREARLMAQLAELQEKYDGLVARLREPVNKRKLNRDLTELMAKQLHYLEHIHGKSDFKTAAETSEAIEGGLRRYATDYIFRSKVTSTVASILGVIDAAMSAALLAEVEKEVQDGK